MTAAKEKIYMVDDEKWGSETLFFSEKKFYDDDYMRSICDVYDHSDDDDDYLTLDEIVSKMRAGATEGVIRFCYAIFKIRLVGSYQSFLEYENEIYQLSDIEVA